MIKKAAGILIALTLFTLLIFQLATATQYLADRFRSKFLASRNLDAVIRSADASYGGEIAGNISYLRDVIPEQAIVLIPSGPGSSAPVNDTHLMQYFLFPRRIVTCPSDCIGLLNDPEIFIIAQGAFPSAELIPLSKRYDAISEQLGIYHPVK